MPDSLTVSWRPGTGSDTVVLRELTDVVRQVLEDRTIALGPETVISDLAGCDSMNQVAIMVETECRFDVMFELEELESVATVGDIIRLVRARQDAVALRP
jgi:acyl carrier protein